MSFDISEQFINIEEAMSEELSLLQFGSVEYIYNPLDYAKEPHDIFVRKYCQSTKSVLFLGMNPGPYGMAQTGVPFGEINFVRDWMNICGKVTRPPKEHPQKLIKGFNCKRSEVSGKRFWGLFQELCITPEKFFESCFVHNYCPLAFLSNSGKNITPPTLRDMEKKSLNKICDDSLAKVIKLLQPKFIIGIGKFAEERTLKLLKCLGIEGIEVSSIMHPSPVNPMANKGWSDIAAKQLEKIGVMPYIKH